MTLYNPCGFKLGPSVSWPVRGCDDDLCVCLHLQQMNGGVVMEEFAKALAVVVVLGQTLSAPVPPACTVRPQVR